MIILPVNDQLHLKVFIAHPWNKSVTSRALGLLCAIGVFVFVSHVIIVRFFVTISHGRYSVIRITYSF